MKLVGMIVAETDKEEPLLPRLRVRFQDDFFFKSGNKDYRRLITCLLN